MVKNNFMSCTPVQGVAAHWADMPNNTFHLAHVVSYFHKLVPFPAAFFFRHLILA